MLHFFRLLVLNDKLGFFFFICFVSFNRGKKGAADEEVNVYCCTVSFVN